MYQEQTVFSQVLSFLSHSGDIPTFIWITDGKVHDVNVLDHLIPEPGAIYKPLWIFNDHTRCIKAQPYS
jgi:hypothetical protein